MAAPADDISKLAAVTHLLDAPRRKDGSLKDPRRVAREVAAILALDEDDDHASFAEALLESVLGDESLLESCVPNRVGDRHHDSETGHPCSAGGGGGGRGTATADAGQAPARAPGRPQGKAFTHPEESRTVQDFASGKIARPTDLRTDPLLGRVLAESGRDAKPKALPSHEVEALFAKGWLPLYRGVSLPEQAEQFRTGDLFHGVGFYGSGTYVAYPKKTLFGLLGDGRKKAIGIANKYAGRRQDPAGGAVVRMALPPDARVVRHEQIKKEAEGFIERVKERRRGGEITAEQSKALQHFASDEGRFAALMNYDAIDVRDEGYMVILNRGILVVDDRDY
jgi:hypothetical protein